MRRQRRPRHHPWLTVAPTPIGVVLRSAQGYTPAVKHCDFVRGDGVGVSDSAHKQGRPPTGSERTDADIYLVGSVDVMLRTPSNIFVPSFHRRDTDC